jgi:hypothetical protein
MIHNIKSALIGVTKQFGSDDRSSALGYGISLAPQANAHATIQATSGKLVLTSAGINDFVAGLVKAENPPMM